MVNTNREIGAYQDHDRGLQFTGEGLLLRSSKASFVVGTVAETVFRTRKVQQSILRK